MTIRRTKARLGVRGKVRYRCVRRQCAAYMQRFTLKGAAARDPLCPTCSKALYADKHRNSKQEHRRKICRCGGYTHARVHRRGSLFCVDGAAGKAGWAQHTSNCEEFAIWYQTYQANKKIPDSEVPF